MAVWKRKSGGKCHGNQGKTVPAANMYSDRRARRNRTRKGLSQLVRHEEPRDGVAAELRPRRVKPIAIEPSSWPILTRHGSVA